MNMKKMTIIYSLIFLIGLSCNKDEPINPIINPPIEKQTPFQLEWATRMDFGKEIVGSDNTQQYGDWILIGGDIGFPATIMAFNKKTGEKDWEYIHDGAVVGEIDWSFMKDNIYIGSFRRGIIAVDVETLQPIWEINLRQNNYSLRRGTMVFREGKIYQKITRDFKELTHTNYLMEIDLMTGDMQPFIMLPDSTSLSPPLFYKDEQLGKELVIYNERTNVFSPPQETQQRVVAIDFETKEEVWRSAIFPDFFASNAHHPIAISDDVLITGADWSIYGLDVHTGKILWRTEFDDDKVAIWNNTAHLVHDGRVYVNNTLETVACLDPKTGAFIWRNPKGGANCTDYMFYYEKENWLVFCSWGYGSVMILDALTGETVHRERPYENSSYNADVIYDEELDLFFTNTYKHAVGFQIKRVE